MKYREIPCNAIEYNTIPCNTIPCNTIGYNTIPCNTMKYHEVPYLGRLKPQLGQKGCILAHWVCFWPFSQAGWFHMGCNSAGWAGRSVAMLWTPNKAIFKIKNVPHKIGPWKFRDQGHFGTKGALLGAPGGPEEARYQVKVCGDHESKPDGPIGGSWDQIWPPGALRGPLGPPKGPFGPETSPFGGPRSAVEVR